jgi:hypothetical protein
MAVGEGIERNEGVRGGIRGCLGVDRFVCSTGVECSPPEFTPFPKRLTLAAASKSGKLAGWALSNPNGQPADRNTWPEPYRLHCGERKLNCALKSPPG